MRVARSLTTTTLMLFWGALAACKPADAAAPAPTKPVETTTVSVVAPAPAAEEPAGGCGDMMEKAEAVHAAAGKEEKGACGGDLAETTVNAAAGTSEKGACGDMPSEPTTVSVAAPAAPMSFDRKPEPGTQAVCPVMNQLFTVKADTPHSEHGGKHYMFCCEGCKARFDQNPAAYPGS